jgi:hypothetical protein
MSHPLMTVRYNLTSIGTTVNPCRSVCNEDPAYIFQEIMDATDGK